MNADGYITTDSDNPLAYNMFAYCGNNPVIYSDPTGCSADEYSGPLDVMFTLLETVIDIMSDTLVVSFLTTNTSASISAKHISAQVASLKEASKGVNIIGNVVAYGFVGLEALTNAYENYLNGEPSSEIMWDVMVDVSVLSGTVYVSTSIGSALGSAIPVVGPIVGAVVGYNLGIVFDNAARTYIIPFLKAVEE